MPNVDTKAFLKAILPVEGFKCLVEIDYSRLDERGKPFRRQRFYATTDELAASILRADQSLHGHKGAVYHGCASYKVRSRKVDAVLVARAFWLDVDIQSEKHPNIPYTDAVQAAEAVFKFARDAQLPLPLLVGSGSGIHGYWPLEEAIEPELWRRYAGGLKALAGQLGLVADPTRTADICSILRPIGTTHRKGVDRPIFGINDAGPYPLEAFAGLLSIVPGGHLESPRRDLGLSGPKPAGARPSLGLAARASNTDAPAPLQRADFNKLADRCRQMGNFRDDVAHLDDPTFYAACGVLAKCVGGNEKAIEWASRHPDYNGPDYTLDKLRRARANSGPVTCRHFQGLNEACKGCPFTTTTPLDVLTGQPGDNLPQLDAPASPPPPDENGSAGYEDFSIFSYHGEHRSLVIKSEDSKGLEQVKLICSFPIYFTSVQTGELKTGSHSYQCKHWHPQDGWQTVDIPAKVIFGAQGIAMMAEHGVVVHDAESFKRFVRESIDLITAKEKRKMQYEQFGWKENNTAFLYGDRLYKAGNRTDNVACASEVRARTQWLMPKLAGSLGGWKDAADRLFGQGSESQSFTILASFAAPLMRFLEDEEGGAIVSLVTRDSGTGKTTSLAGAYTVWSTAARGLSLTAIDTKVSKGITLATLGNLPVIYDEFRSRDPDLVREFVEMFTNGRDKMRGNTDGGINHTAASWQTILFTASNASLINSIQATGQSDAPAFRILEFPVESSGMMDIVDAGRLKKTMEHNAGHAGDAFMRYLVQPGTLEWLQKKLPEVTKEIYAKGEFRKEHRFWVRTLGAVGTAALIVKHLGLVSFSPDRVMKWAVNHFIEQKNGNVVENTKKSLMVTLLAQFMNDFLGETLVMQHEYRQGGSPQQPFFMPVRRISLRREVESGRYLIDRLVLRDWLAHRDISLRELETDLLEKGIVTNKDRMVTLGSGTDRPGGQVHAMVIDGFHPLLTGALAPAAQMSNLRKMAR